MGWQQVPVGGSAWEVLIHIQNMTFEHVQITASQIVF